MSREEAVNDINAEEERFGEQTKACVNLDQPVNQYPLHRPHKLFFT